MTTVTLAQKRRTKTRTKRVSHLPPLTVSALAPNEIDLLPGTESLVCPDCRTWCPITGQQGATPKLVPHHTERAGTAGARRCTSSNRRVVLDLTIPEWRQCLADAITDTASRRSTKVIRKPKTPPAPPVSRIGSIAKEQPKRSDLSLATVERVRADAAGHRIGCTVCTGYVRCEAGRELDIRLAETEASWTLAREQQGRREQDDRAVEQREITERVQKRTVGWRQVGPAVARTDAERELERARADFEGHRNGCAACAGTARCEAGSRKEARLHKAEAAREHVAA